MAPRGRSVVLTLAGLAGLTACGGQEAIAGLPVADAGFDRVVSVGTEVLLDGGGSVDPDERELTYQWTLDTRAEGSAAVLVAAETREPRLTPDVAGIYVIRLVVDNGSRESTPDRVAVRARGTSGNRPPVAIAGCQAGACSVAHGDGQLRLNGNQSSDPDGDPITFLWTQINSGCDTACPALSPCAPVTAPVTWVDAPTSQSPYFTAPDAVGALVFSLTVTDDGSLSSSVCLRVEVTNNLPIAWACTNPLPGTCVRDISVEEGLVFNLNGERSSDPDDFDETLPRQLGYSWSATTGWPSDVIYSVAGGAAMNLSARAGGAYVGQQVIFQLTVSDGHAASVAVAPAEVDACIASTVCSVVRVRVTDAARGNNDPCYFDSECSSGNCDAVFPAAGNCVGN